VIKAEDILEKLTTQHVIQILNEQHIEYKDENNIKTIKCKTVCHCGNSFKLTYMKEEKFFYCLSECGGMSIFSLLMNINGWKFQQSMGYIAKIVGISMNFQKPKTFGKTKKIIKDWEFIEKYRKNNKRTKTRYELPTYDKKLLNVFDDIYPSSWLDEFISLESMRRFGICFHTSEFATIIPHYGFSGNLVGIRSRHFLQRHIDAGRKYMPTILENIVYAHPLQFNLYGAFQNKKIIQKKKKVLLLESEKGVLQCQTYYGDNNFSVAQCGSSLSNAQRDILVYDLKVEEVIIGLDKQYENLESKEHDDYIKKVSKIADKLVNYVNVYIIYCTDDQLGYKESPTDKGKETLESLMNEKIRYYKNDNDEE